MSHPISFRAGDSASWTTSLPSYKASDGWSLKYRLLSPTGKTIDIATTTNDNGDDFDADLTSTDTSGWSVGESSLVAYVEKGADRVTLGVDPVIVLPNLVTASSHDGRSKNAIALAAAEDALLQYLQGGKAHVAEYEIDGRRLKFRSVEEIRDLIDHYKSLIAAERTLLALMSGGQPAGRVYYRG